jgi:signal transduction histidine kinase
MGLWAVVADATTTTGAVTTTSQTTTTLGPGAGGGGQGVWDSVIGSSELWAALLGALIGGFATAVGSYILYRMQSKRDIRIQIYDDLIPKVAGHWEPVRRALRSIDQGAHRLRVPAPTLELITSLGELRRAGAIVGGAEAQMTSEIRNFVTHQIGHELESPSTVVWLFEQDYEKLSAMNEELVRLIGKLHNRLERKITSRYGRLRMRTPFHARSNPDSPNEAA